MFKLEFDATNLPLAAAIGGALLAYANGETLGQLSVTSNAVELPAAKVETVVTNNIEVVGQLSDTVVTATEKVALVEEVVKTSAETATEQVGSTATNNSATVGASTSPSEGNDPNKLDEKGVGFNKTYCGNAAIPFNQSGKKKGQWKKRQGVTPEAYDAWYAASLAAVVPANTNSTVVASAEINTDAAFTPQNGLQTNANTTVNNAPQGLTFADAGEFLKWLSENQAADRITTADIDAAYAQTQTGQADLFNPAASVNAIANLYNFLGPIAGGQ